MGSYNYTISIGHLGEQLTLNQWVLGSSPRWCTRKDVVMKITTSFFSCHFFAVQARKGLAGVRL